MRALARARPATPFATLLERRTVRCALWSDGSLVIEAGDARLQLDSAEARSIVQYLTRMAAQEAAA